MEAELLTLKEGISLALQWSNLHIDVESDCLEALMMIKGVIGNKCKYAFIIKRLLVLWRRGVLALIIFVGAVIMLVMS